MREDSIVYFDPPLWQQRRSFVFDRLKQISTLLDIGCGEGSLLSLFINRPLKLLAGVDVSDCIYECQQVCQPTSDDYEHLRERPLTLWLFKGSLAECDNRLRRRFEAITCTEVIEHLHPHELDAFPRIVLGQYQPRILIVTTPNKEFNTLWKMDPNAFRHWDHKFEWTRQEFREWCCQAANAYGYSVEFAGVGKGRDGWDADAIGYCTQIAVFTQCSKDDRTAISEDDQIIDPKDVSFEPPVYECIDVIQYPYFTQSLTDEEKLEWIKNECDWLHSLGVYKNRQATVNDLWMRLKIRQACTYLPKLIELLKKSNKPSDMVYFRLQDSVVHFLWDCSEPFVEDVTQAKDESDWGDDFTEIENSDGWGDPEFPIQKEGLALKDAWY